MTDGIEQRDSQAVALDWSLAERTATRLVRPGPVASRGELVALVEAMRLSAERAIGIVSDVTGLSAAASMPVVRVLDRSGWVKANTLLCRELLGDTLTAGSETSARMGAVELGAGISVMSSKVLGQFDPYGPTSRAAGGQLLLVAPNVLAVERALDVDPHDFRLWVCLHEQTHALQFATAPWLVQYLTDRLEVVLADLAEDGVVPRLLDLVSTVAKVFRDDNEIGDYSTREDDSMMTLLGVALGEDAQEAFTEISAVMSLLEGHADVVMDLVDPSIIPTVDSIRAQFETHRGGRSKLARMGRRLLGFDVKLAQYRHGAGFVRDIIGTVGMAGLNEVWTAPELLPTPAEMADPSVWLRRVHAV